MKSTKAKIIDLPSRSIAPAVIICCCQLENARLLLFQRLAAKPRECRVALDAVDGRGGVGRPESEPRLLAPAQVISAPFQQTRKFGQISLVIEAGLQPIGQPLVRARRTEHFQR